MSNKINMDVLFKNYTLIEAFKLIDRFLFKIKKLDEKIENSIL